MDSQAKSYSKAEILEKLDTGSKLRWISGDIIGNRAKLQRFLFLDSEELDDDTTYLVIEMEQEGVLLSTRDRYVKERILNYSVQKFAD
jgi:hypothetical protein